MEAILDDVASETEFVRKSSSQALTSYLQKFPDQCVPLVSEMGRRYKDLSEVTGSLVNHSNLVVI